MKKEIEKLEKKIKNAGRLESFFDKLSGKITKVKSGTTIGFAILVLSTIFMSEFYYCLFGALGVISAIDLIVESQTNYGENISDNICQKYSRKKRELEKEKDKLMAENLNIVDKDEIKKAQRELGLNSEILKEKTTMNKGQTQEVEKE